MQNIGIGGFRAWLTVALGAVFYGYQFILRVSTNVMKDDIMQSFGIDALVFGVLVGVYYWSYSPLQIPLGIMMDRWGPRRLIGLALLLCGISCFIFASTQNIYIAGVARFILGMGSACGFLGSLKLGTMWVQPTKFGTAIAFTYGFGTLGGAIGGTPLEMLTNTIGWQPALYILGVVGIILAAVFMLIVREKPTSAKEEAETTKESQHLLFGLQLVAKRSQSWLIAGYSMLMYVPMVLMGDAWSKAFMKATYDTSEDVSASFATAMFVGGSIGSLIFPILSDYMQKRLQPMLIGAIGQLFAYSMIVFVSDMPLAFVYGFFLLAGLCYSAKGLSFAAACEIVPRSQSGVAVGFNNMIVMTTGIVFHPFVGYLLKLNWDGKMVDDTAIYSSFDYRLAMSLIPIALLLAVLILKFIKETHPGRYH